MNFKNQSFLRIIDYKPEDLNYLIDLAADLKAKKKAREAQDTIWEIHL